MKGLSNLKLTITLSVTMLGMRTFNFLISLPMSKSEISSLKVIHHLDFCNWFPSSQWSSSPIQSLKEGEVGGQIQMSTRQLNSMGQPNPVGQPNWMGPNNSVKRDNPVQLCIYCIVLFRRRLWLSLGYRLILSLVYFYVIALLKIFSNAIGSFDPLIFSRSLFLSFCYYSFVIPLRQFWKAPSWG